MKPQDQNLIEKVVSGEMKVATGIALPRKSREQRASETNIAAVSFAQAPRLD